MEALTQNEIECQAVISLKEQNHLHTKKEISRILDLPIERVKSILHEFYFLRQRKTKEFRFMFRDEC